MEYVFIDTSIFFANNFLEGKEIRTLLDLSKDGHIKIVMPQITLKEIIKKAEENAIEAFNSYNATRDKLRVLRNIESLKAQVGESKINESQQKEYIKELHSYIKKVIKVAKITIIDYPTLNIQTVFDKYFNKEAPFNNANKKNEFPDAFSLATIEQWCEEHKHKCVVFALDKDFEQYQNNIINIGNSKEYINNTLTKIEKANYKKRRLKIVEELYKKRKRELEEEITEWFNEQLHSERTYRLVISGLEILEIEILDCESELQDYNIVSISDMAIEITATCEMTYKVRLSIPDKDYAYFDEVQGDFIYERNTTETFRGIMKLPVLLKAETPIAGDEFTDLEIESINSNKDILIWE